MTDTLRHRGPDDAGTLVRRDERVALGHRRLSIIDLSPPATSRWPTRTARCGSPTTARSTTTRTCGRSSRRAGHRTAPTPTPRRSSISTRSTGAAASSGSTACSPSRSGTRPAGACSSRAIGSGSSRCITPGFPTASCSARRSRRSSSTPRSPRDLDESAFADYLTFGFTPPPQTMFRGIGKLRPGEWMTVSSEGDDAPADLVGPDAIDRRLGRSR